MLRVFSTYFNVPQLFVINYCIY